LAQASSRQRIPGLLPTDIVLRVERLRDATVSGEIDRVLLLAPGGSVAEGRIDCGGLVVQADQPPTRGGSTAPYSDPFGLELWKRLPATVSELLLASLGRATATAATKDGGAVDRRLVLSLAADSHSSALPWERLRLSPQFGFPQLTGRLAFVRHLDGAIQRPLPCVLDRPAKVLLLVGDIGQLNASTAADRELGRAIDDLRQQVAGHGAVELTVASSWPLPQADHLVGDLDSVQAVQQVIGRGFDVVHLLLHNNPLRPGEGAFEFGRGSGAPFTLTDSDLLHAIGAQTRVLVLGCCSVTDSLARRLAEQVDHVVGTFGAVDPADTTRALGSFYQHWLGPRRVDLVAAMRDVRAALHDQQSVGAWRWQHWCRDLARDPLVFPEQQTLHRYLESLHQKAGELNHALVGGLTPNQRRQALAKTYVRLDLQRVGQRLEPLHSDAAKGDLDPGKNWQLGDLLRLDRHQHPWATGRWLVVAPATSGKTSLLRETVRWLTAPERRRLVPILVTAQQVAELGVGRLADLVKLPDVAALGDATLRELRDRGLLLFVCDAVDEVDEDKRGKVDELLHSLLTELRDCPVVIARREAGVKRDDGFAGRSEPAFVPLSVQPLEPTESRELVQKWIALLHANKQDNAGLFAFRTADDAFTTLWAEVESLRGRWLREALRNPFVCGLTAVLFSAHAGSEAWRAPQRRHELWQEFVLVALSAAHQGSAALDKLTAAALLRVLEDLALAMFERGQRWLVRDHGRSGGQPDEAVPVVARCMAQASCATLCGSTPVSVLGRLEMTGVFGRLGETKWRFELAGFQDVLAARRLHAMASQSGHFDPQQLASFVPDLVQGKTVAANEVSRLQQTGEALSMVTSHLTTAREVEAWLKFLQTRLGDREVVIRAVEYAAPDLVGTSVLESVVKLDDRGDRAKAIRGLAERIQDAAAAAGLLRLFASMARNAEDLWLIHEVAAKEELRAHGGSTIVDERLRELAGACRSEVQLSSDGGIEVLSLLVTKKAGGSAERFAWRRIPLPTVEFLMGSPSEDVDRQDNEIQHPVLLTVPYWLQETTLTVAHWALLDADHEMPYVKKKGGKQYANHRHRKPIRGMLTDRAMRDMPAIHISWQQVQIYARFVQALLRQATGNAKAKQAVSGLLVGLPTEAQWEWASRGGYGPDRRFGALSEEDAARTIVHGRNWTTERADPVSLGRTQAFGLRHMLGNVWEWVEDWCAEDFGRGDRALPAIDRDPTGPNSGEFRVLRGGSFVDPLLRSRCAARDWFGPVNRNGFIGARLCLRPPPSS
jgi:formylglycine-generating enzyme required for sulfatase activity